MTRKKTDCADIDEAAFIEDAIPEAEQQKALLKTDALQSAIFNSANFSSIATDASGVIQIFNVGAERMLGYTAADVMNKITPADLSDPQELIARAEELSAELDTPITPGFEALVFKAARGIEDIYELTYIRKDGSRFPAVVSVTALRDAQNEIIGYLLIGYDNTASKQNEAEQEKLDQRLRDQQFYTRSLIESSIDALMTTDPSGIITDVNKQMEALTGCTRDELIGATFKNYFTDPRRAEAGIQLVLRQKALSDYELTARDRDGKETVVSYNASTFYDRDRILQGVFAAARDVTEQKQASLYARSLIEASLDPLVTINPDGKITDVNESTIKATGISRDKLIGTDFSDYFTEPEKAREGYQEAFSKGFVRDYPLAIRHKTGRITDVLYNAAVYKDDKDNVLGLFAAARDVTESKRITREFVETRNFLDNILQSSIKYSIIGKDLDERIVSWNEGACRNYGYTAEEIIGRNSQILHTPEDIASGAVAKLLATALEKGLAESEFERVRKDGSRFWANLVVTRRNDAYGKPIGYLLMSSDISEQKEAVEQLHFASQYARSLIEASLDPLVTISPDGKITDVNEASAQATGVPRGQLIGTDFSDYFTEPEKAREGYQEAFSRGFVRDYPLAIRHKSGRIMDVLYNASVYQDGKDNVLGVFAAARDVTMQKQASQYARSLIEASMDPLVTISPDGKITDVNESTIIATGISRDKLIGTDFSDYFTEPEKAREGYQEAFSRGFVRDYPLAIRHKSGRIMDVLYNASVYKDDKGNVQGLFAAARDVTERKRLDQILQENNVELESAKAAAEKANLAKSEFLSSMSHELRSPLNAILGFGQLMETDSPPPTDAQKENIAQILQAGWHLLTLINEILDLAKVESGQVPMSREPMALAEVLQECQSMIEPQAQEHGIGMIFPQSGMPYFIHADRTRVKQVLINLLSNAIKYNREQGTVEVVCTESTPGRLRISIKDSGAGLTPEQLGQLFQPFNRLGQEAGGEEGTGIGLVVAKRLVELMGGSIGVESSLGGGSVFWIELVLVAKPVPDTEENAMTGDDAGAVAQPLHMPREVRLHSVLYVEDNPANMRLVEQIIARHPDLKLLTAVNAYGGIEIARNKQPDLILLDINLPDISGFEALKILREDPVTVHIPVIAISANAMPTDIKRGMKAGFFRYLTKPIKVDEFMDALNVALEIAQNGGGPVT